MSSSMRIVIRVFPRGIGSTGPRLPFEKSYSSSKLFMLVLVSTSLAPRCLPREERMLKAIVCTDVHSPQGQPRGERQKARRMSTLQLPRLCSSANARQVSLHGPLFLRLGRVEDG